MRKQIVLLLALTPPAAFALDTAIYALRGFPTDQVAVEVFTTMELKGQKEDYGDPTTTLQPCANRLLPTPNTPACWWLRRHREIIRRY